MTPTSNSPEALVERLRNSPTTDPGECDWLMNEAAAQITALSERLAVAQEALPVFERVTRLAHTLASDVPITAEARKHIDAAYASLAALTDADQAQDQG